MRVGEAEKFILPLFRPNVHVEHPNNPATYCGQRITGKFVALFI
jgi:hypothetical protein